jgi:hypothetical protein
MKKILSGLGFLSIILLSCGSNDNKHSGHQRDKGPRTEVDSLYDDVMDGHDVGMAKMGRLTRAEQATRRLLDSIAKLPGKARLAAEPIRVRLDSLQKELRYAEFAMNKWMEEFNVDSAVDNTQERVKYLAEEKLKVTKVKEAILNGLQKADSVLKEKF